MGMIYCMVAFPWFDYGLFPCFYYNQSEFRLHEMKILDLISKWKWLSNRFWKPLSIQFWMFIFKCLVSSDNRCHRSNVLLIDYLSWLFSPTGCNNVSMMYMTAANPTTKLNIIDIRPLVWCPDATRSHVSDRIPTQPLVSPRFPIHQWPFPSSIRVYMSSLWLVNLLRILD